MSESRVHQRKPLRLQLNYRDATGGNFLFEFSKNISKGGIFIETRHPLPLGAHLVIRFQPPGHDELEVEGIVAWLNPWRDGVKNPNPGMGIEWKRLSAEQHELITQVVKAIAILPED
jgi:uncharacterized protein (TIGR02266 family)